MLALFCSRELIYSDADKSEFYRTTDDNNDFGSTDYEKPERVSTKIFSSINIFPSMLAGP